MLAKLTFVLTSIGLVGIVAPSFGQTAIEKARLARTMWSAFQCGMYAGMSGDEKEQARLFDVGIKAGRDFLESLNKKQIPTEIARQEVPIGVSSVLQGPTPDFIIGRIFENSSQDAYDAIVKKENGIPLDVAKWIMDEGLKKSKAKTHYLMSNCVLVK